MDAREANFWERLGAIQHLDFRLQEGSDVSLETAFASIPEPLNPGTVSGARCLSDAGKWNDRIFRAIIATEDEHWPVRTSLKYIKDCLQEISRRLREALQDKVSNHDQGFYTWKDDVQDGSPIRISWIMSLLVSAVQVIPVVAWLAGRNAATKISEMASEFGDLAYDVRALIVLRGLGVDFSEKAGVGCAALFLQCISPIVPTRSDWGPGIKVIIDQPIQVLRGGVGCLHDAALCITSRCSSERVWYRLDSKFPFLVHFSHSEPEVREGSQSKSTQFILTRWTHQSWVAAGLSLTRPLRYKMTEERHHDMVSKCTKLLKCGNVTDLPSEQLVQLYEEHGPCQLAIVLRIMLIRGLGLEPDSKLGFSRRVGDIRCYFHEIYYKMVEALRSFPHQACPTSYMRGYCSCEREGPYLRTFMPVERLELFSNRKERLKAAAKRVFKWERLERKANPGYKGIYYVGKHIYQVHASVSESRERTLEVALVEYVSAGETRSISESINLGVAKVTSTNQILGDMPGKRVDYGNNWKTCVESGNEILWRLISRIATGYTAVKADWSSCWATALDKDGVVVDFVPTLFLLTVAGKVGTVKDKLAYPSGALATVKRVNNFAHIEFAGKEENLGGKEENWGGKEEKSMYMKGTVTDMKWMVAGTEGTLSELYDLPLGGGSGPMDTDL